MNILLTNDDGYTSKGLLELKKILQKYGDVYMVAPKTVQSGKGCALTTFIGISAEKVDDKTYIVDGTPVDCVQFASLVFKDISFDLIVSGCNNGYNLSNDIMYSGTCGACFQALIFKKKAIAFSADKYVEPLQLIKEGPKVLDYILKNHLLSKNYYLNVNFQNPSYETAKGILITKPFIRHSSYKIISYDPENKFYKIEHHHGDITHDNEYDVSAVYNGYISITPMSITTYKPRYRYQIINKLKRTNM